MDNIQIINAAIEKYVTDPNEAGELKKSLSEIADVIFQYSEISDYVNQNLYKESFTNIFNKLVNAVCHSLNRVSTRKTPAGYPDIYNFKKIKSIPAGYFKTLFDWLSYFIAEIKNGDRTVLPKYVRLFITKEISLIKGADLMFFYMTMAKTVVDSEGKKSLVVKDEITELILNAVYDRVIAHYDTCAVQSVIEKFIRNNPSFYKNTGIEE